MSHEIDSFGLLIHHSLSWTVVGKLDQTSSHVVTFWVLSLAFWIKVFAQKHLDDLLHSAGKASPLLSGRGLSYNHCQRTHRRLPELDIPKIEIGTAVVINNLWSILNNTTANIDIALTRCPIVLAG